MTIKSEEGLTATQASLLVAKSMIGTGILILPSGETRDVGTPDGWIAVLLSGIIVLFLGYAIARLSQHFPGQTFFQYSRTISGKWLGICHGIVFVLYFTFASAYLVRLMGEVIRMYLLDTTPIEVIIIAFMSVAAYVTLAGISCIARVTELYFPVILIILVALILTSLSDFKMDNIRPVLGSGWTPVLKGIKTSAQAYSGFEVMLLFTAFMKEPQKAVKATLSGIGVVVVFYTLIVLISIGTLTAEEVKTTTWPTMSVAKNIELPGGFFERFESMFSVLWVLSMYTAFVPYQYAASLGIGQLLNKDYRIFVFAILPVIYMIAMFPRDLNGVFKFGSMVGNVVLFVSMAMPLYFLLLLKLRGNRLVKS